MGHRINTRNLENGEGQLSRDKSVRGWRKFFLRHGWIKYDTPGEYTYAKEEWGHIPNALTALEQLEEAYKKQQSHDLLTQLKMKLNAL